MIEVSEKDIDNQEKLNALIDKGIRFIVKEEDECEQNIIHE